MAVNVFPEHVADKWRPIAVEELPKVQVRLDEANALLHRKVPGLDAAVTAGTVDPVLVRMVITDAVVRVLQNPFGVTSQTVGPESATYSRDVVSGRVAFTDEELALVTPPGPEVTPSGPMVGSVRLRAPDYCFPSRKPWW